MARQSQSRKDGFKREESQLWRMRDQVDKVAQYVNIIV